MIRTEVLYSKSAIATQILLTCNGKSLLVDAGDGVLRDLTAAHFEFENLLGVLITHEHSDHTGGLFSLLHFMKHIPRKEPMLILAPRPVLYLKKLLEPPLMYSTLPFEVSLEEADEAGKVNIGPFAVESFRANHIDFHSIGYSISDMSGYRVVVSGDTTASPTLRSRVRGADIAVLESTFEDGQEEYAMTYGHMTASQAREVGKLAKRAVLIHEMPQEYFKKMTCSVIEANEVPLAGRASSSPRRLHRRTR